MVATTVVVVAGGRVVVVDGAGIVVDATVEVVGAMVVVVVETLCGVVEECAGVEEPVVVDAAPRFSEPELPHAAATATSRTVAAPVAALRWIDRCRGDWLRPMGSV